MEFFDPATIMCEVIMEEGSEDNESVIIPNLTEDSDLPPIPRFDLQSEPYGFFPSFNNQGPSRPTPIVPTRMFPPEPTRQLVTPCIVNITETRGSIEKRIKKTIEHDISTSEKCIPSIIFGLPIFKKVYTTPDNTAQQMQAVTIEETKFYSKYFSDTSRVSLFRLHCTTCDKHIGCGPLAQNIIKRHRGLNVLVCKGCYDFYGDDKFPTDKEDNTEVFCRWCGQGGKLVCCSFCPKVFCYNCINRNFQNSYLKQIQGVDDWACFFCASKPLWALRAICRALIHYRNSNPHADDDTNCCKRKKLKGSPSSSKEQKTVDKPMVVFNHDLTKFYSSPRSRSNPTTSKAMPVPRASAPQLKPAASPSAIVAPSASLSAPIVPSPGQLATPPTASNTINAHQQPPTSKIQSVHIDHSKTSCALVKLSNTAGFELSLRVFIHGQCMRIPKPVSNPNFPTKSTAHAFQVQRLIFDRLTTLNQKHSISAEEKANSLLSILDDWKSLIGLVENDVKNNLNIHQNNLKKRSHQAKCSENLMRWNFPEKCPTVLVLDDDSDIEIIEDDGDSDKTKGNQNLSKRKNNGGEEPCGKKLRTEEEMANGIGDDITSTENKNNEETNDQKENSLNLTDKGASSVQEQNCVDFNSSTEIEEMQSKKEASTCQIHDISDDDAEMKEEVSSSCGIEAKNGEIEKNKNEKSECDSNLEGEMKVKNNKDTITSTEENNVDKSSMDLKSEKTEDKADKIITREITESDDFCKVEEGDITKETRHSMEEPEVKENCNIQDNSKVDVTEDLNKISSSVKDESENNTQDCPNKTTTLETSVGDLEEKNDNSEISEKGINDSLVMKSDFELIDKNLTLPIPSDKSDVDLNSVNETEPNAEQSVSKINDETPQDDADIIKLLDGELSKLENASNDAVDNLSAGSNESSMKFDQTLLDEIDNVT